MGCGLSKKALARTEGAGSFTENAGSYPEELGEFLDLEAGEFAPGLEPGHHCVALGGCGLYLRRAGHSEVPVLVVVALAVTFKAIRRDRLFHEEIQERVRALRRHVIEDVGNA